MIKFSFKGSRLNHDVELWWESTDPKLIEYKRIVLGISESLGIMPEYHHDGDSYTMSFVLNDVDQWFSMEENISKKLPNMSHERSTYFKNANHTLTLEVSDYTTGKVLSSHRII